MLCRSVDLERWIFLLEETITHNIRPQAPIWESLRFLIGKLSAVFLSISLHQRVQFRFLRLQASPSLSLYKISGVRPSNPENPESSISLSQLPCYHPGQLCRWLGSPLRSCPLQECLGLNFMICLYYEIPRDLDFFIVNDCFCCVFVHFRGIRRDNVAMSLLAFCLIYNLIFKSFHISNSLSTSGPPSTLTGIYLSRSFSSRSFSLSSCSMSSSLFTLWLVISANIFSRLC